jgi:hypothetical protein
MHDPTDCPNCGTYLSFDDDEQVYVCDGCGWNEIEDGWSLDQLDEPF